MGKATSGWIDQGAQGVRLFIDIPLRKNGLPNQAAQKAVEAFFETFNPDAFDPPEPVPELVARAALRDKIVPEYVEITAEHPPVPVYEDDEMPGPRCAANGQCYGD